MKTKLSTWICLSTVVLFGLGPAHANNGLPANFPGILVSNYNASAVAEGYIFLAVGSETEGVGFFVMMLENDGTPVWFKELPEDYSYDFKVLPNGFLHYAPFIHHHSYTGGGDAIHEILDDSYNPVETIRGGNRYVAEAHDFQLLPNGHILQFGYYMSEVDMSQIVDGGYPAALVSGGIAQELDAQRNVVFQWRSWDAYEFEDHAFAARTRTSRVLAEFHLNTINQDPDGNIILGTPSEIRKINRQTGEVMWTWGGSDNEFTPVGPGADVSHFGGHATYRLENGNFLMYDNGPRRGAGTSTVHEYTLDEVQKTATHVWTYTPDTPIPAWHRGNAQRLPNGNTFIGWGGASGQHIPACTEVTPQGEKVWELYFAEADPQVESYRAFKFKYPPDQQFISETEFELGAGNPYNFPGAGVSLEVESLMGDGYNEVTVTREPYAPTYPVFPMKAPRVLPLRFVVDQYGLQSMTAEISFAAAGLNFDQPEALTIYHRETPGQGLFVGLPTEYNPASAVVRTTMNKFGEFIFGYPDLADVPFPPILAQAESDRGVQDYMFIAPRKAIEGEVYAVNQERPISLAWSPRGLARWYELEIATDSEFNVLVVDVPYQTEAYYVWNEADPDTTYSYRVKTWNEGGSSAWSVGTFQTVPPTIELTAPNGGESWQRGLSYFIQWQDNIAEDVVIDLYQGGVFLRNLVTTASTGAYEWEVGLDLDPGYDYAIKISSVSDAALYDMSDTMFANDWPVIDAASFIRMLDGSVEFQLTAPGAAEVTVWGATTLHPANWQELETMTLTDGGATFTDTTATSLSTRFYRVSVP